MHSSLSLSSNQSPILDVGNTVGSLELPSVLHARKNLSLEMSDFQKEVLIGCILGDAYISKLGKVRIEQSVKEEEYVLWKYSVINSLLYSTEPRKMVRFPDSTLRVGEISGIRKERRYSQTLSS